MPFLESIRLRMHSYNLRKELKRNASVQHSSISLDDATRIGILFSASDKKQEELVLKYVDRLRGKHKKKVNILGFFDDKEEREFNLYKHYNHKDLDWTFRPKKDDVKSFMSQKFDILISFMDKPSIHADYIMALSHARLRVGRNSTNTDAHDLIINERQGDAAHFIGLVDTYLKIFNNKSNEPQPV